MEKKVAPKLEATQTKRVLSLTTKSAQIRFLASCGYSRGDISRILNIRYQHVRNVLITPLKSS